MRVKIAHRQSKQPPMLRTSSQLSPADASYLRHLKYRHANVAKCTNSITAPRRTKFSCAFSAGLQPLYATSTGANAFRYDPARSARAPESPAQKPPPVPIKRHPAHSNRASPAYTPRKPAAATLSASDSDRAVMWNTKKCAPKYELLVKANDKSRRPVNARNPARSSNAGYVPPAATPTLSIVGTIPA